MVAGLAPLTGPDFGYTGGEEMAKIDERAGEPPMTRDELREYRRRLSMLHPLRVRNSYREAWQACRMDGEALPAPRAVQELVQAWKQLWKWRRGG